MATTRFDALTWATDMHIFLQQVVQGLATGSIYALLALALVLSYRATSLVNFAQGEMAMFATFIAWLLVGRGWPLLVAIAASMAVSFVAGALIERLLLRRIESNGDAHSAVIVTIGLLLAINSISGAIWAYDPHAFPSLFSDQVLTLGNVRIGVESIGIMALLVVLLGLLYLLFKRTEIGLAMRAVASNKTSSRLIGIRVGYMLMLGWGLAAALGALSGALVAPQLFLSPMMMTSVLSYALAAAALGGYDSPVGAVVGGLIVGVAENLAGTYIEAVGSDLKILVPLAILLVTLLLRPQGLFGSKLTVRV